MTRRSFVGAAAGMAAGLAAGCATDEAADQSSIVSGINHTTSESIGDGGDGLSRRVMPASQFAQSTLLALCPEYLVSLVEIVPDAEIPSSCPQVNELPVTGPLTYFDAPLEFMEVTKAVCPDMVLDVGVFPAMEDGCLDGLEAKLGVPIALVDVNGMTVLDAMKVVADLFPARPSEDKLSVVSDVEGVLSTGLYAVQANERVCVHLGVMGEMVEPVFAEEESADWQMLAEASADQWRPMGGEGLTVGDEPDLIVAMEPESYADYLDNGTNTTLWSFGTAREAGTVVPGLVASRVWLSNMSGFVKATLGALWLGNFLYPNAYECDINSMVQHFYSVLFGREIDEAPEASEASLKIAELKGMGKEGLAQRRSAVEAELAAKGERLAREADELNNRKLNDDELNALFDAMGSGTEEQRQQFLDSAHEMYGAGK